MTLLRPDRVGLASSNRLVTKSTVASARVAARRAASRSRETCRADHVARARIDNERRGGRGSHPVAPDPACRAMCWGGSPGGDGKSPERAAKICLHLARRLVARCRITTERLSGRSHRGPARGAFVGSLAPDRRRALSLGSGVRSRGLSPCRGARKNRTRRHARR